MNFNFIQHDVITTYKSLLDSFFDQFFILPICVFFTFFLIIVLNIYDFYSKITSLIHKDYVDEKHMHKIRQNLKNLSGFREEVVQVENSQLVVATIDKFLNEDYSNPRFTYDEIQDLSERLESLVSSIQKLGIDTSGIVDKTEQKINAILTEIIEKRSKMTFGEIITKIKEKVSIFGIFNLYDEFEL